MTDEALKTLETIDAQLDQLNVSNIAKRTGFVKRMWRKIEPQAFLKAFCFLGYYNSASFSTCAIVLSFMTGGLISRQAVAKRISQNCVDFLRQSLAQMLSQKSRVKSDRQAGAFAKFKRVLVQDSSTFALPRALAGSYPGSKNQNNKPIALMRIQNILDLKNEQYLDFGFSPFTRNDQAASYDILEVAGPGDLVLRDLGYYTTRLLSIFNQNGVFFLTRYRHG